MESRFGLKFRRPANQLRLTRDNYAVPSMKTRIRSYSWRKKLWLSSNVSLSKDEIAEQVLVVDFINFKESFGDHAHKEVEKYEALLEKSKTVEGANQIIDEKILSLIQEALWLDKGFSYSVSYALRMEDLTQPVDEKELVNTRLLPKTEISEFMKAVLMLKHAYPIIKKRLSLDQVLQAKYPQDEYEYVEIEKTSSLDYSKHIQLIKNYIDNHKDEIAFSISNYTSISQLLEVLTQGQIKELYMDIYSYLLETDDLFLLYLDNYAIIHTDDQCEELRQRALANYDINMQYCSSLNKTAFRADIKRFLKEHPDFQKVEDLHVYNKRQGVYVMVLGGFCQAYIGISKNIFNRIQQHWLYNQKPLDRLIMGDVETSIMSIDSFLPLDTTEIYVKLMPDATDELLSMTEKELVCNSIDQRYLLNRTQGGTGIENLVPRYREVEADNT